MKAQDKPQRVKEAREILNTLYLDKMVNDEKIAKLNGEFLLLSLSYVTASQRLTENIKKGMS